MADAYKRIEHKLAGYSSDVQQLARKALELSESLPESAVTEQLKGIIRSIVRREE